MTRIKLGNPKPLLTSTQAMNKVNSASFNHAATPSPPLPKTKKRKLERYNAHRSQLEESWGHLIE